MSLRFLISLLSVILISNFAGAQPGVTVGYTNSHYKLKDTALIAPLNNADNFNVGVCYHFGNKIISLEPTLSYIRKGAVNKFHKVKYYVASYSYVHDKLHYLNFYLPVKIRIPIVKDNKDWHVTAGVAPYVSQLIKANAKTFSVASGREITQTYSIGNSEQDALKQWDAGISLIAGVSYDRTALLFQYENGLLNIAPQAGHSIKNRSFSLNLQFRFW